MDVDLPQTTSKALPQKEQPMVITINKKGEIYFDKIKGDQKILRQQLADKAAAGTNRPIFLKADREVPYGLVVAVMTDVKEAGFDKLGMITQPKDKR